MAVSARSASNTCAKVSLAGAHGAASIMSMDPWSCAALTGIARLHGESSPHAASRIEDHHKTARVRLVRRNPANGNGFFLRTDATGGQIPGNLGLDGQAAILDHLGHGLFAQAVRFQRYMQPCSSQTISAIKDSGKDHIGRKMAAHATRSNPTGRAVADRRTDSAMRQGAGTTAAGASKA